MIGPALENLLAYGLRTGLIPASDLTYTRNRVLEVLQIRDYTPPAHWTMSEGSVDELLAPLLDDAARRGLIAADSLIERDLLDTAVMGCFVPQPARVIRRFEADHTVDPVRATDAYHRMSVASNYIRVGRTDRNITWEQQTRYGPMTMTINVSKPEKDPQDIAARAGRWPSSYPLCLLCRENEGYAGNADHPARQNLRLIPVGLAGETWYLQYSPYRYFNEHCIVLSEEHRPMALTPTTFERLAEFTAWLPHYLVGSNADLPIVGGSILDHDHFQGGRHEFPMENARELMCTDRDGVRVAVLDWPLVVLRVTGPDVAVVEFCTQVLAAWRDYDDPGRGVFSRTGDTVHNSLTPIARRTEHGLRIDLILRNNRTDAEHPDGIFHPHADIHVVKKENIGLIEAMGLAILPGRLAADLEVVAAAHAAGEPLPAHMALYAGLLADLKPHEDVRTVVGEYFVRGLEQCGVFGHEQVAGCQEFLTTL